ncbi:MAG: hemolysin family protein [Brachybacterium sp.]|nr:hemolysin family protein [Brachybacterium sp.]
MSTDPLFVTVSTVLLIAVSAFFVIIEFSLLAARRHRLEAEASTNRNARAALRGINELTVMMAGAQLGITLCTFALGAITKPGVDAALLPVLTGVGIPGAVAGTASFVLSLLVVTFLHLVIGEMAPKSWAIAHPELSAKTVAVPARVFITVVRPLLLFVNAVANRLVAASGVEPVDRAAAGGHDAETIRQLVEHSGTEGVLTKEFHDQLSEVLALREQTIESLIDPDDPSTQVEEDGTVADVQREAIRSGHKRIIVHRPGDGPPGVIHVRDTLLEDAARPVGELDREAFTMDADTPVHEALTRIREANELLAAVMKDGRFIGVITVADIMHRVLPSGSEAPVG